MPRELIDGPAIASFLETQDTGVLALASGDDAYGIPVAFAFEADESALYFRLGYGGDSQKRSYIEAAETVTFTVYDDTPEGWKSVVAEGELETLTGSNLESAIEESIRDLEIPYFGVQDRPDASLEHNVVRLEPTKLTGVAQRRHGQQYPR